MAQERRHERDRRRDQDWHDDRRDWQNYGAGGDYRGQSGRDTRSGGGEYQRGRQHEGGREFGRAERYGRGSHAGGSTEAFRPEGSRDDWSDYPEGNYARPYFGDYGRGEYRGSDWSRGAGAYGQGAYRGDYGRGYGAEGWSGSQYRGGEGYRGGSEAGAEPRGFWDRASDEVSSWFGDQDAERRRRLDEFRGRGPKNYARSDDRIREDVCDRLSDDSRVDASDVDVTVSSCEVTLSGTVADRDQRRRAEDCAEQVSGVKHVQNNLRVKERHVQGLGGSASQ